MEIHPPGPDDLKGRIKWLIAFRLVFAGVLLGATLIFCASESIPFTARPFIFLVGISLVLFFLSVLYFLLLNIWGETRGFVYGQVFLDTVTVTVILFLTGGFASVFTFLYLLVIIGVSMILHRAGSLVVAALSSVQYGLMIDLEYYGVLVPLGTTGDLASAYAWTHIIYRMVIIMSACFAVAFLTGILAVQTRRARHDLAVMERHLKRVEKMAAIGELAAGIAHEIKNPLASISGSIQLLREDLSPGMPNYQLMQIVLRETDRLSKLVTDFLLFANPHHMGAKRIFLDRAIIDTVALFRQDPVCGDGIVFDMNVARDVHIHMDAGHLRQVLFNLLKNAAESMDGGGTIAIDLSVPLQGKVKLCIKDDGCGIEPEVLSMMFDPFYTTKNNGTGLGLAITHRIMESYGGMVDVTSVPGEGTSFVLIFRLKRPKQNLDTVL
ncbi:two-component system, NtrC family, sensor histidine kinase PilS [Desulfocicer vacuolatum DSM 3385]|uniref:histidine kinase n=1 Tax=Desulfocicer vacuolatum DSM 3385 TaxID=1121400 RepID=A0A1W1ZM77_9BACT|nr:ATP-binding protein [Desulfocicer vacuolatum]SMC49353.1 two-component system, NtrC family, sensor histidine kinase PilS [Desulfocicer vacuolatum DSM 3385]